MNIKQLEYFVDLASTLNFTKTAKNFYISQTAITKQIQNLEHDLDLTLFLRTKKEVVLSQEGETFLPYAKQILHDVNLSYEAIKEYKRGKSGIIKLGFIKACDHQVLLDLLEKLKNQFPLIQFQYQAYPRQVLLDLFKDYQLDAIIMYEHNETQSFSKCVLKNSYLRKYYHRECNLSTLPLIYDVQDDENHQELEQTLIKLCLKEGYAILHDFIEYNQYAKDLNYKDTFVSSPLCFFYLNNHTNFALSHVIDYVLQTYKKDNLK